MHVLLISYEVIWKLTTILHKCQTPLKYVLLKSYAGEAWMYIKEILTTEADGVMTYVMATIYS